MRRSHLLLRLTNTEMNTLSKRFSITIVITFTTLLIAAQLTHAQKAETKITPAEYKEANIIAKKFYRRFIETKDIGPLFREFYVKDFRRRLQKAEADDWSMALTGQSPPPAPPFERRPQLQKLYESERNVLFLMMLYTNSLPKEKLMDDDTGLESLPLDVKRVMQKNKPLVTQLMEDDFASGASHYDKGSVEFFDKVMDLYRQLIPLLRKAAVKINAGKTKLFRENTKHVSDWMQVFQPWSSKTDNYMGLPDGTRIIYVNIPYFQLALVKENKRLRVINFVFYVD